MFDNGAALQTAVTKTATFTSAWLDLTGKRFLKPWKVVLNLISAISTAGADTVWRFDIEHSDDGVNSMGIVGELYDPTTADSKITIPDGTTATPRVFNASFKSGKRYIRLVATKVSGAGSIQYEAYIAPANAGEM